MYLPNLPVFVASMLEKNEEKIKSTPIFLITHVDSEIYPSSSTDARF